MFYVYILVSRKDGEVYIGYTQDLRKRMEDHQLGKSRSTRGRFPMDLVYYEAYRSGADALRREKNLKYYGKALGQLKRRIQDSLCAGKGAG